MALKIKNSSIEGAALRTEANILKKLSCLPDVPKFVLSGRDRDCEYLAMELFGGEDMASLRNRMRSQASNRPDESIRVHVAYIT